MTIQSYWISLTRSLVEIGLGPALVFLRRSGGIERIPHPGWSGDEPSVQPTQQDPAERRPLMLAHEEDRQATEDGNVPCSRDR